MGLLLAFAAGAAACGDSEGGSSSLTPVQKAEAVVDRAHADLEDAEENFSSSSTAFCADAKDLIGVVDRYGRAVQDEKVTVGDVQTAADDIQSGREASGASADQAVEDNAAVLDAKAELAAAEVDLANAKAAEQGQSTTTVDAPPTPTSPLVPEETVESVSAAESTLKSTARKIDADTPVVEAGVQVSSAAFAVEVAWLRLFAEAGCLTDSEQATAVDAVAAYTTAVQEGLTTAGFYDGPVDGVYGADTVAAVEELQADSELPVTGLVDQPTELALDAAVTQQTGSAAAGVSARTAGIQGGLKALGYWDGPVDGNPSEALTEAVAQLQGDLGLEPSGVVDPATLDAIARAGEEAKQSTTTTMRPTDSEPTTTTTTTAG